MWFELLPSKTNDAKHYVSIGHLYIFSFEITTKCCPFLKVFIAYIIIIEL